MNARIGLVAGGLGLIASAAPAQLPDCTASPLPFFTFAVNGGVRFAPIRGPRIPDYYVTFGLEALRGLPGHLAMESGGYLGVSRDQGCSWELLRRLNPGEWPLYITAAPGGNAYAWQNNGSALYAILSNGSDFNLLGLRSPVGAILGLGTDPADPLRVRIGGPDGQIHESTDGGQSWQPVGDAPDASVLTYRMVFDPRDLDHALFCTGLDGAWVTFDGGDTWTLSQGLSISGESVNCFNAAVSPVDSNVVWAMALDIGQSDDGHPSQGRHFYLSLDGGLNFTPVVDDSPDVTITNGPEITPHPTDPAKMAWAWGSRFSGMDVWEYDAAGDELTHHHKDGLIARVVEYYPENPRHMYIGLEAR